MRSKVFQRFFRRSSIVVRPILLGAYTCRVSQGNSAFSAKHDKVFAITSFVPGMRDNVFLTHSPIIFMNFSTSSLYELSLKLSMTSTTKRVESSPVRKKNKRNVKSHLIVINKPKNQIMGMTFPSSFSKQISSKDHSWCENFSYCHSVQFFLLFIRRKVAK